jgi:hypothetical protein
MASQNFTDSIRQFAKLPLEKREQIVSVVRAGKSSINLQDLAIQVAQQTSTDFRTLQFLFEGIAPMVPFFVQEPELRKNITELMLQEVDAEHKTPELSAQIYGLLGSEDSIGLTGKAQNIIWGHGRSYSDAHIVTQIRPIFFSALEKPVKSAVIVHEIRLDYQESNSNGSHYITMDAEKINRLIDVLRRALRKEKSIREGKGFDYLGEGQVSHENIG